MSHYSKQALDQPATRQCEHVRSGICQVCAWPRQLNLRFLSRLAMPTRRTK